MTVAAMSRMTVQEVVQRSEVVRHERSQPFHINFKPMYSMDRIRRRALCEALCEGIPDADLLAMQSEFQKLARTLKAAERSFYGLQRTAEPV